METSTSHTEVGMCVMCAADGGFGDPEFGFHVGTLTHEAGRLSRLRVYRRCLETVTGKIQKSFGVMLMT